MSITLKVLNAKTEIASYTVAKGETLTIKAIDEVNYQLIDNTTGLGPQNIIAKRVGNDLQILFEDGDQIPEIIIDDYYGDQDPAEVTNLVIGQHENGNIYAYVPESGEKFDAVNMLAEHMAAPQALGGNEISGLWVFSPWWLLALGAVAGGVALAAGGGSGGSKGNGVDTIAPEAPTLKATDKDGDNRPEATGTAEPGSTVTVTWPDGSTSTTKADDKGNWTVEADKPQTSGEVKATATDAAGNTSEPAKTDYVDTTVPAAPTVTIPEANDGVNAAELADGIQVQVTLPKGTEAGDTVTLTITNPDGSTSTVTHEVTKEEIAAGGTTITIPKDQIPSDGKYTVVADIKDPAGNVSVPSETVTFDVDATVPGDTDGDGKSDTAPTVTIPEAKDGVNAAELADGIQVEVTLPKGTQEGDAVTLTIANPDGSKSTVTQK